MDIKDKAPTLEALKKVLGYVIEKYLTRNAFSLFVKDLTDKVSLLTSRVDNLITETDTDGTEEIADIRIGANGISYSTAGTAVRSQISDLDTKIGLLDGIQSLTVTKDKIDLSLLNIYGDKGSIIENARCTGFNTSTYELSTAASEEYNIWYCSINDLSEYDFIVIPFENEYDINNNTSPVLLLGETNAIRFTKDNLSSMANSVVDDENGIAKLPMTSLLWYTKNREVKTIYVTLKKEKPFVNIPSGFNAVNYIPDNGMNAKKIELSEHLVVPPILYIAEGDNITIWAESLLYGNTIKNYAMVEFVPTNITGYELRDGAIIINGGSVGDSASITINYYKYNTIDITLTATISIRKFANNYGKGKKKIDLYVGDSWIQIARIQDFVLQLLEENGMIASTCVGSHPNTDGERFTTRQHTNIIDDDGTIIPFIQYWKKYRSLPDTDKIYEYRLIPNHGGQAGYGTKSLCTKSEFNSIANAYFNPDTQTFDMTYFMDSNSIDSIDNVVLHVGFNDLTVRVDDEYPTLEDTKVYLEKILTSINEALPNAKIGLCIPAIGGLMNGSYCLADKNKRLLVAEHIIETYKGSYSDRNIYLIPVGVCVNPYDGYQTGGWYRNISEGSTGAYIDDSHYQKLNVNDDALHLNEYGNMSAAKTIFAWLKSVAYK